MDDELMTPAMKAEMLRLPDVMGEVWDATADPKFRRRLEMTQMSGTFPELRSKPKGKKGGKKCR